MKQECGGGVRVVVKLAANHQGTKHVAMLLPQNITKTSVMIEQFAFCWRRGGSELLDLNRTSKSTILVSLIIPKFATIPSLKRERTSE